MIVQKRLLGNDGYKVYNDGKLDRDDKKFQRQVQYWDPRCKETRDIIEQCSQEQVLEWIKDNPGVGLEQMDSCLGNGCLKYACKLCEEKKIIAFNEGWKINEVKQ